MPGTIPWSWFANAIPGVLNAGGTAVDLNGVLLSQNPMVPYPGVQQFSGAAGPIAAYGATSQDAILSGIYFKGFTNCTALPGTLYIARYPESAIAAWLQSGSLASMTVTQLQALSGSLTVAIDGYSRTAASINLSSATSFSSAASIIQTALNTTLPTGATVTGSIAGTTLTVTSVASGTLSVGQTISGTGITAGTQITALLTGSGAAGTYTVSTTQTVSSTTITATGTPVVVSFNSTNSAFYITSGVSGSASSSAYATGTLAASLNFTQATGAVLSQGANAATPATFMASLLLQQQNWVCFGTVWESVQSEKEAFAQWSNSQSGRFLYVCQDSDINVGTVANSAETFGYYLSSNQLVGTCPIYGDRTHMAFTLGAAAALDFTRLNGRVTLNGRAQSGLVPYVTDLTTAGNVKSNGYNFYGAFGSNNPANNQNCMSPGSVSGQWLWWDTFLNQVWLNANLQLAMAELLLQVGSIPYNAQGYGLVDAAALDPINAAINFGAIRKGVVLSSAQVAEIQYMLGFDASSAIQQNGFYLQIQNAPAATRVARSSPPMTLIYQDGESIQALNVASVVAQ
jgi:hypothetical protein